MKKLIFTIAFIFTNVVFATNPTEPIKSATQIIKEKTDYKILSYYESGKLQEVGYTDLDGKKINTWTRYSEEGVVIATANFKNGKKDGEWIMYDNNGKISFYLIYKKDKLITGFMWTEHNGLICKK